MTLRLGLVLSHGNARRLRRPEPDVALVLLERTLHDPPRAAAARRWSRWLHASFPEAELIPYAWHLVTHAPEDGLRARATRTLDGAPHAFGLLQDTGEVARAWEATRQTMLGLGARRIALRTPPGLAPGPVGRRRLQSFVERHQSESLTLVWEPQGLWTPFEATDLARALGITPIVDAFEAPEAEAWLKIEPLLRRARLDADGIDTLLDIAETRANAVMLFGGPAAVANLHAFRDALGATGP